MLQKTIDQLRPLTETIRKNFNPKDIVLFGSQAYGNPSGSSDVDLLVIMNTFLKPHIQAALIRIKLDETVHPDYPIDILVRTPKEVQRRIDVGDNFFRTVMDKGIRL